MSEETANTLSTKREQVIALFMSGTTDLADIVRQVKARPTYVAFVLQSEGLMAHFGSTPEENIYRRFFRNVLCYKDVEAAKDSVTKINRLHDYFERIGDREGQHQAMVLALTGKNRARWSGKIEESQIFSEWLAAH